MDQIESQVTERFAAFAQAGDTTPLYEALAIVEAAERQTPPGNCLLYTSPSPRD